MGDQLLPLAGQHLRALVAFIAVDVPRLPLLLGAHLTLGPVPAPVAVGVALALLLAADPQLLVGHPAGGGVGVALLEHVPLLVHLRGALLQAALQPPAHHHGEAALLMGVLPALLPAADRLLRLLRGVAAIGVGVPALALLLAADQLPLVVGEAGGGMGVAQLLELLADQAPGLLVALRRVGVGLQLGQGADQLPPLVIAEGIVGMDQRLPAGPRAAHQLRLGGGQLQLVTALAVGVGLQAAHHLVGQGDGGHDQRVHRGKRHQQGETADQLRPVFLLMAGSDVTVHLPGQTVVHAPHTPSRRDLPARAFRPVSYTMPKPSKGQTRNRSLPTTCSSPTQPRAVFRESSDTLRWSPMTKILDSGTW